MSHHKRVEIPVLWDIAQRGEIFLLTWPGKKLTWPGKPKHPDTHRAYRSIEVVHDILRVTLGAAVSDGRFDDIIHQAPDAAQRTADAIRKLKESMEHLQRESDDARQAGDLEKSKRKNMDIVLVEKSLISLQEERLPELEQQVRIGEVVMDVLDRLTENPVAAGVGDMNLHGVFPDQEEPRTLGEVVEAVLRWDGGQRTAPELMNIQGIELVD